MRERVGLALTVAAMLSCSDEPAHWVDVDAAAIGPLGPACLSGRYWAFGDRGDNFMHPGRDCIGCHTRSQHGPRFSVAGTLYSARHEADECFGYDSDTRANQAAEVEVTDAAGERFFIIANRVGNFYTTYPLRFPLHNVRVYAPNGTFSEMSSPVPHGDCNACHTRLGTITDNGESPGRVTVPQ